MKTYYQCDCGELTKNDNGFCSEKCKNRYNITVLNIKTNHVLLPEPKFEDINTSLLESCGLTIDFKFA